METLLSDAPHTYQPPFKRSHGEVGQLEARSGNRAHWKRTPRKVGCVSLLPTASRLLSTRIRGVSQKGKSAETFAASGSSPVCAIFLDSFLSSFFPASTLPRAYWAPAAPITGFERSGRED